MRNSSHFKKHVQRFSAESSGTVAILFALSAIPVMMAAGLAVDMMRSNNARNNLQAALDAGALSAAAAANLSVSEREAVARATFAANFKPITGVIVNPAVSVDGDAVSMSAEFDYPTAFMRVAGYNTMDIASSVTVNLPETKKAEIALVLDYSGSMAEWTKGKKKYIVMRDATIQMVEEMTANGASDRVKFGLAPFSHHVHVTLPGKYVVGADPTSDWTGCTQDRKYPHNLSDDTPNSGDDDTKWGHAQAPEHLNKGCAPYAANSLSIRPISDDHAGVISQLEDMKPYAWTHIALGFSFGWQLISPNVPFGDVAEYNDDETMKVIVLLTDGRQTEPAFGPGSSRNVANGESNLEKLCQNAKAKGVTVVTVAFDLQHQATEDRLRNCSSDQEKYFFIADDGAELSASFEEIRALLQQAIYISK